jgi:hypothetical protein
MFEDTTININERDWKTCYPAEQVGEYLLYHDRLLANYYKDNKKLAWSRGMLPTLPEPTLDGFLKYVAERSRNERKRV